MYCFTSQPFVPQRNKCQITTGEKGWIVKIVLWTQRTFSLIASQCNLAGIPGCFKEKKNLTEEQLLQMCSLLPAVSSIPSILNLIIKCIHSLYPVS